jgi:hypothetical protein
MHVLVRNLCRAHLDSATKSYKFKVSTLAPFFGVAAKVLGHFIAGGIQRDL